MKSESFQSLTVSLAESDGFQKEGGQSIVSDSSKSGLPGTYSDY
jgi:hypothetical protein